ncbi:uncharacterized protein LOC125756021 [Canis lupus dingo]|uniref:uncharacterized protein LOC125756021 n=1 Tax=Canis lupus dingo TaxID=286419 RepID=UPI0020C2ECD8|nr:uncharacterized protein LOC125756021 [Canis lupus dingo]
MRGQDDRTRLQRSEGAVGSASHQPAWSPWSLEGRGAPSRRLPDFQADLRGRGGVLAGPQEGHLQTRARDSSTQGSGDAPQRPAGGARTQRKGSPGAAHQPDPRLPGTLSRTTAAAPQGAGSRPSTLLSPLLALILTDHKEVEDYGESFSMFGHGGFSGLNSGPRMRLIPCKYLFTSSMESSLLRRVLPSPTPALSQFLGLPNADKVQ